MFQYYKNWMEFWFLVLMIIGGFIALLAPSAVISYVIAFMTGLAAGRLIYERKEKIKFPYLMVIAGFAIGYLIGVYYGNRKLVIFLFVIGAIIAYKLYSKKILKDTKY